MSGKNVSPVVRDNQPQQQYQKEELFREMFVMVINSTPTVQIDLKEFSWSIGYKFLLDFLVWSEINRFQKL